MARQPAAVDMLDAAVRDLDNVRPLIQSLDCEAGLTAAQAAFAELHQAAATAVILLCLCLHPMILTATILRTKGACIYDAAEIRVRSDPLQIAWLAGMTTVAHKAWILNTK